MSVLAARARVCVDAAPPSALVDEENSNTLFIVDEFPTGEALTAPVEGEDKMIAATIFSYNPGMR